MKWVTNLLDSGLIRLALMGGMFYMAYTLTAWAMAFASTALAIKSDLMGAAAVIAAVSAAPIAILTMLVNNYLKVRNDNPSSQS